MKQLQWPSIEEQQKYWIEKWESDNKTPKDPNERSETGSAQAQFKTAQILCPEVLAHAQRLADALSHSADKLNDVFEWSKAYCESNQACSVAAVEREAREALKAFQEQP